MKQTKDSKFYSFASYDLLLPFNSRETFDYIHIFLMSQRYFLFSTQIYNICRDGFCFFSLRIGINIYSHKY